MKQYSINKQSAHQAITHRMTGGILIGFVAILSLMQTGCGVQAIPRSYNHVEAKLSELTSQYKRRADLVKNLVETVKGYAAHEKSTFEAVTNARAKANNTVIDPSNMTPEKIKAFMGAQNGLSQALSRLMVVVERYPELKADKNFMELQRQIESTENLITGARKGYIEAIKGFNNLITVPPTSWTNSMFYKHDKMPQWTVPDEEKEKIEKAPEVKF